MVFRFSLILDIVSFYGLGGEKLIEIVSKEKRNLYSYNVGIVKKYGHGTYKVAELKTLRNKGVFDNRSYTKKCTVNDKKLDCNIRRAKSKIQEYVMCNEWDMFITLTLDKTKYDRYNLKKFHKDLTQFIRIRNREAHNDIKYLFIPEEHKDGAWHIHGFIRGLDLSELRLFTLDEKLPLYIREKLSNGQEVYQWVKYYEKFGFCDLEPIRDKSRASSYVRKYITKELAQCVKETGAHMYYCSRGLKVAEIIQKGTVSAKYNPTYIDEHVSVQWVEFIDDNEALTYLQNKNNTIKQEIQLIKQGFSIVQETATPF